MRRTRDAAAIILVGLIVLSQVAHAQLARRGREFRINSVTEENQLRPRVAALPNGGFVVVWENEGQIAARRFDPLAQPVGAEFQIPTQTPCYPPAPHVAAAPDGSLLVTWCAVSDGQTFVRGQRFDARGQPQGSEVPIAQDWYAHLQDPYAGPDVAAVGSDQFIVTWTGSYRGQGRIVTPAGQCPSFDVASRGEQYDVAAAGSDDGSFRVLWYDGGGLMQGRQFKDSQASGDAFDIASVSSGNHQGPVICSHDSGEFIVAWSTYGPDLGVPVTYRAYDDAARPRTLPLHVTPDETVALQFGPAIACARDAQFAIGWIQVAAIPAQSVFRVRIFNYGDPPRPSSAHIGLVDVAMSGTLSLAYLSGGDLIATWHDCAEASGCDVFAQRFAVLGDTDCPGDCNYDGQVTVNELVFAVNAALAPGRAALVKPCLPADVSLDYRVSIDELVLATRQALGGCSDDALSKAAVMH